MKKLTKWLILFVGMVMLVACGNKRVAPSIPPPVGEANRNLSPRGEATEKVEIARDTIEAPVEEKNRREKAPSIPIPAEAPTRSLSPKRVRGESYSKRSEKSSYDNMRGFDPASEDDMDDNGMSRYMENNDEEGWD